MCEDLCHERLRLYYAIHWNLSRWLTIEVTGMVPAGYPWSSLTKDDKAGPPLLDRESPWPCLHGLTLRGMTMGHTPIGANFKQNCLYVKDFYPRVAK